MVEAKSAKNAEREPYAPPPNPKFAVIMPTGFFAASGSAASSTVSGLLVKGRSYDPVDGRLKDSVAAATSGSSDDRVRRKTGSWSKPSLGSSWSNQGWWGQAWPK